MVSIGGIPALLSYFYAVTVGLGELPINFSKYYNASVLSIAIMASWAFWTANTIAIEVKLGLRSMSPRLASMIDTAPLGMVYALAGVIGGILVGITHYVSIYLCVPLSTLSNQPPQWPLLVCSACTGFLGIITSAWLVSTLQPFIQYRITENAISDPIGNNNHLAKIEISQYGCIDLLTTVITSCTTCYISLKVWPVS